MQLDTVIHNDYHIQITMFITTHGTLDLQFFSFYNKVCALWLIFSYFYQTWRWLVYCLLLWAWLWSHFDIKVFVMLSNFVYLMERKIVSHLCHWAYDHTLVIIVITNINIKLLKIRWDRVMTQQYRPLASEDLGWFLIPKWQLTISCNCRSKGSNALFWPPLTSGMHAVYNADRIPIHIKKIKIRWSQIFSLKSV